MTPGDARRTAVGQLLVGAAIIGTNPPVLPLTVERIAGLPAASRTRSTASSSSRLNAMVMRPSSGVYLTALLIKLRNTTESLRGSVTSATSSITGQEWWFLLSRFGTPFHLVEVASSRSVAGSARARPPSNRRPGIGGP